MKTLAAMRKVDDLHRPVGHMICVITAALAWVACGAPIKTAGEVAHIFRGQTGSLQSKVSDLCQSLAVRTAPPSFSDLAFTADCSDAGSLALNYLSLSSFYFEGVESTKLEKNKVIHLSTRSQVWLNKTVLGLASAITGALREGILQTGVVDLAVGERGGQEARLVTPKITIVEPTRLDEKQLKFSMTLNFKLSGVVRADHDIKIDGKIMQNAIAVSIRSLKDAEFRDSILKNFRAMALVVPHAADVYVDFSIDMNVHNVGVETVIKDQLRKALGSGLKSALDALLNL